MDLFKWTKNLKPKFPNVVEEFFGKIMDQGLRVTEAIANIPAVNISDRNKAFEVSVAVPGLEREDINVEIRNNCLVVSSEKQYENEESDVRWMRREYGYASFQRIFMLPPNANADRVKAHMKNGILTIEVGKVKNEEPFTRMISVQ